jgi:hypothetical protein
MNTALEHKLCFNASFRVEQQRQQQQKQQLLSSYLKLQR